MNKVCCKCNQDKPLSRYYINPQSKDGIDYECKDCRAVRTKIWRKRNLKKSAEITRLQRQRTKKQLVNLLGGKCVLCEFSESIAALDFPHKEPHNKYFNVMSKNWSFRRLKNEALKCVLLCANCHRMVHTGEKQIE